MDKFFVKFKTTGDDALTPRIHYINFANVKHVIHEPASEGKEELLELQYMTGDPVKLTGARATLALAQLEELVMNPDQKGSWGVTEFRI